MKTLFACLLIFCLCSFAFTNTSIGNVNTRNIINDSTHQVTGKWKGVAETANGSIEFVAIFKVSADSLLTGEYQSSNGNSPLRDGKVKGYTIEFTHDYSGIEVKATGKLEGGVIKIHWKTDQYGEGDYQLTKLDN